MNRIIRINDEIGVLRTLRKRLRTKGIWEVLMSRC